MSKPTLYDRASGNVLMEGTPEYELEYKYKHNTPAEYKKVLNAYRAKYGATQTNNKKTRKSRKHGGYTDADIQYEVSMAERGYQVSKFARNAVRKALQKKGMDLSANGKIVRGGKRSGGSRSTRRRRN